VFHRRAGKTVLAINELIRQIVKCPHPNPRGHYVAPTYNQAKRIAWQYLKEFTRPIPGVAYNESELRLIMPGGREIQLLGGESYDRHRGIYSDYAILDEYAQMHPQFWGEVFRPALSDREGGAIFIGTPKGHNAFFRKWEEAANNPDWFRAAYRVTETGAINPKEILSLRREMSEDEFNQEYMNSWEAAIKGSYWAKEVEDLDRRGGIMSVPHDPELPVYTSWDLGVRNFNVVHFWQIAGREIRMIDCEAYVGTGFPEIIRQVKSKPYVYEMHIGPHDLAVFELGSGKTRLEIARELGIDFDTAPRVSLRDGIEAVRAMIPRMVIDRERCSDSLEAMRLYRTEYDERSGIFSDKPFKDWSTDYADSIRYFAITDTTQLSFANIDYSRRDRGRI
jgi:phage terminase large subunit